MEVHLVAAGRHILGMGAIERVKKLKAPEKANVDSGYYLKEIEKKKEKNCTFLSLHSELRRVGGQVQLNLKVVSAPGGCAVGGMRSREFWEEIV